MLLTIDSDEHFIDVECVAITTVLSLQSSGVKGPELNAPEPDCFAGYSDATFSEQIFNIPMAKIESIVEPDGIRNDVRRESVAFIGIPPPILPRLASLLVSTGQRYAKGKT